jgi:hypothetical protein
MSRRRGNGQLDSVYDYDAAGQLQKLRHMYRNQSAGGNMLVGEFKYDQYDVRGNRKHISKLFESTPLPNVVVDADDTRMEYRGNWVLTGSNTAVTNSLFASWSATFGGELTLPAPHPTRKRRNIRCTHVE